MVEQKVENAARQVIGSVPSSWSVKRIAERLERLKPMYKVAASPDLYRSIHIPTTAIPPPATYLMWLQRTKGLKSVYYQQSVLLESNIDEFEANYSDMLQEALLTAELDVDNFVAEQEISQVQDIIQRSVLSISSLYKYLMAQEHSLEFLLSDEVILKAIKKLRANPYLFFSYGDDAISLMPVKWKDL